MDFVDCCVVCPSSVPVLGCEGSETSNGEAASVLLCGGICFGGDIGIVGLRIDLITRAAYRSLESGIRYDMTIHNLLSIPRTFTESF